MRVINGKHVREMEAADLTLWAARFQDITVDFGAGDGRFIRHMTRERPGSGAIAIDLCEANMIEMSRKASGNALFVVADALALPKELSGVATRVTINFPWGSLLRGLLGGDERLLASLVSAGNSRATIAITLNAGALVESGLSLESGANRVAAMLRDAGVSVRGISALGAAELRQLPTTWAKRLAFGRDPRAIRIDATMI